ncbi:MAG: lysylphosphatidylglycerol synthase domain-containing protein [Kineosporiaceae bacterium]|jgi:uncharacterized membrane protein YbhN (UPF0104 family)
MTLSQAASTVRCGALGLVLTVAAAGLLVVVPRVAGTTWGAVAGVVAGLSPWWVLTLAVVWIAGLLAYTAVLTASLPGLSVRQGLALNLAGSAVANGVPAGGPASMALTTAMARSWGFGTTEVTAFLTVSNVWTAAGRVAAGLGGLVTSLAVRPGGGVPHGVVAVALPAALVAVAGVGVLGREHRTAWLAGLGGRFVDRVDRRRGRPSRDVGRRLAASAVAARRLSLDLSRRSWHRFTLGTTAYLVLLVVLLDACLRAVGHVTPVAVVVAAVGLERLATAVPLTPGGAGVAEVGLVGMLTAGGAGPAGVAAALLYRLCTFGLEIPVGASVAVGWGRHRRRTSRHPVPSRRPPAPA